MAWVCSQAMTVHLLLASRAMYAVSPFPAVGSVIVTGFFFLISKAQVVFFFPIIWIAFSFEQGSETVPFEGM